MIVTLKFLHLFALLLGGAASGGSAVLGELTLRSGAPPPPTVASAMNILMKAGLVGLLLLWLTGPPLASLIYGGLNLGGMFAVKLALATLALGLSLAMNAHALRSRKQGKPPNPKLMRALGRGAGLSVIAILALTAVVFDTKI